MAFLSIENCQCINVPNILFKIPFKTMVSLLLCEKTYLINIIIFYRTLPELQDLAFITGV